MPLQYNKDETENRVNQGFWGSSLLFFILFPNEKLTKNPRGKTGCNVSTEIHQERDGNKMATVICLSNEKGGCAKSVTAANLGFGLARHGKKVLLLDADAQGSLTISLGNHQPDKLSVTLATVMEKILNETDFNPTEGTLHHDEGVDLMPANIKLAKTEILLASEMERETKLRQYIDMVRPLYEYIVIDTSPSLGLMTVNALAASDKVIIPVAPKYLDVKGLELLLKTIAGLRKKINPNLEIGGILFTMVDRRSKFTKEIIGMIESAYGGNISIFKEYIPLSVRAAETSREGKSIYNYDPKGKVAAAYAAFVEGVLGVA
jgi:chromosome partitioning protein